MNEIERTNQTYEQIATDYAAAKENRQRLASQLQRFTELLPSGGLVLDVGCGPGFDTAFFCERGLRAVGVDRSWAMMQTGRQQYGHQGNFVQVDMRCLPFAESVAGLWVCASLLHIPRPNVPATLRGFARVLVPDGILYISVKQGDGESWSKISYGHQASRFFTYWQPEELDPLLETAGFEILDAWLNPIRNTAWVVRFARKQ